MNTNRVENLILNLNNISNEGVEVNYPSTPLSFNVVKRHSYFFVESPASQG